MSTLSSSRRQTAVLRRRIARGDYEVDEYAVAEAMLSRMLIPVQLFGPRAVRRRKDDAGAGPHKADPGDR